MANSLLQYFSNEDNIKVISKFKEAGLNLTQVSTKKSNKLEGLTFVITGTLPTLSRTEAAKLIENNGGNVSSGVSKKTSYLLAGEDAGSKLTKATELSINIISQEELMEML